MHQADHQILRYSSNMYSVFEHKNEVSFHRHNRALQAEYKKARRNDQVVQELMSSTFAMRIMMYLKSIPSVDEVLCRYKF